MTNCEHNKRKDRCNVCNPCEHGNIKYYCTQCGNIKKCPHGKQKYVCKECKGSSICEHNRLRHRCKECKGGSICEHKKEKSCCKECGGGSLCVHYKKKSNCKECGGSSFCEHKIERSKCKECKGSQICQHNKRRQQCKECGGKSYCNHGKRRALCKECGGSSICAHNKDRSHCKECKGSQICKHNKPKQLCKECDGKSLCKSEWCETTSQKKYNGYCTRCCVHLFPDIQVSRNYKTKEIYVRDYLIKEFNEYSWISDKKVYDGCSKRRPDMFLDMGSHVIIIEIDENKHSTYDCSCENKRIMELSQDVNHRPIVFIRFNPDSYIDKEGNTVKSCWKNHTKTGIMYVPEKQKVEWNMRLESLKTQVEYWINNSTDKTIEIIEMFY